MSASWIGRRGADTMASGVRCRDVDRRWVRRSVRVLVVPDDGPGRRAERWRCLAGNGSGRRPERSRGAWRPRLIAHAKAAGATFEIYADNRKEYRWRLKASNGQVIATGGQGYKAKADCRHGVEAVQKDAAGAKIVEVEEKA